MYTAFNVVENKDEFKEMFSFTGARCFELTNKVNQIFEKEPVKAKNEGMTIPDQFLEKSYKAMESVGKPLNYAKQASLEQNTEFTNTLDKIWNAIKDLLGINDVKTEIRKDLKNAVAEIAKGFTIDSKSINKSKNTDFKTKSQQLL